MIEFIALTFAFGTFWFWSAFVFLFLWVLVWSENESYWETNSSSEKSLQLTPQIKDYKGKLIGWIMFWVTSLVWTLLNDPIRRIANWIYLKMSSIYQNMANSIVNDKEI